MTTLYVRSGKNTHISMISNSVTHLRNCTNTILLETLPILPETPHERRCRHIEWRVFDSSSGSRCFMCVSRCVYVCFHDNILLPSPLPLKEVCNARLGESDQHPISPKTPTPQHQPTERKKRKRKQ